MLDVCRIDLGLSVTGALDHEGGRALLRAVEQMDGDVYVDASRVEYIDGAGLTALAVARRHCRSDGRTFVLTRVTPDACSNLRIGAGLATLFAPATLSPTSTVTDTPAGEARQDVTRVRLGRRQ